MALTLCPKLVADNIAANCEKPIYPGLENLAYIINKEDIASVTYSGTNPHIVTAIALNTGVKAFKIYNPVKTPLDGTQSAFAEGDVTNKVDNTLQFIVLDDGPKSAKDIVDGLLNGEFVVVFAHKWENTATDNKFQIFGLHTGLKMTAGTAAYTAADGDGGMVVTLTETGATTYGMYFFDTDIATSRAALEALC